MPRVQIIPASHLPSVDGWGLGCSRQAYRGGRVEDFRTTGFSGGLEDGYCLLWRLLPVKIWREANSVFQLTKVLQHPPAALVRPAPWTADLRILTENRFPFISWTTNRHRIWLFLRSSFPAALSVGV